MDTNEIQVTPVVLIPLVGWLTGLVYAAGTGPFRIPILVMAVFMFAIFAYHTVPQMMELRRQWPIGAVSVLASLPLFLVAGGLALLYEFATRLPLNTFLFATSALVGGMIFLSISYLKLTRQFVLVAQSQTAPNEPIESLLARIAWGGLLVLQNICLLAFTLFFLSDRWVFDAWPTSVKPVRNQIAQAGLPLPSILAWSLILVVSIPLLMLFILWTWHIYTTIRSQIALSNDTTHLNIDTETPIRIIDSSSLHASARTSLQGKQSILITKGLLELLDDDELQAVIAHESYHLKNRDPLRSFLASLLGLLVGGKSTGMIIFDFPRIERQADLYAADQVGTQTVIRTLRRIEAQETRYAAEKVFSDNSPELMGSDHYLGVIGLAWDLYNTLFGNLILANAHSSVDERVQYILASERT
ncbi:M48 family metalloprotease [Halovenus amylolytica]|uniref:M48 family metalloprotease n=1 Tax=Halovenus amylolytica TaxID=2500550 RepID=UPI00360F2E4D